MVRCGSCDRPISNRLKFCFYKSPSRERSTGPRWRRSDSGLAHRGRTTMAEANEKGTLKAEDIGSTENSAGEQEVVASRPRWRQIFHQAVEKARRDQGTTNRRELGRDHTRSLFVLVAAAIAIVLLFLGIFSAPNVDKTAQ